MLNYLKKQCRELVTTFFLLSLLAAAYMSKDRAVDRLRYLSANTVLPARISQQGKTEKLMKL